MNSIEIAGLCGFQSLKVLLFKTVSFLIIIIITEGGDIGYNLPVEIISILPGGIN
jgi:hypothetical protein